MSEVKKDNAVFWLKQIKERYIKGGDEEFDRCREEAIDMAIEALKEYKTGKWIVQPSPFYKDTTIYICPFCKSRYKRNSWAVPKFCQDCGMKSIGTDETHKYAGWKKIYEDYPNCGAKMEADDV